jgi:hypothetical protein
MYLTGLSANQLFMCFCLMNYYYYILCTNPISFKIIPFMIKQKHIYYGP